MTGTGRAGTTARGPERREREVDRRGGVCRSNDGSRRRQDGATTPDRSAALGAEAYGRSHGVEAAQHLLLHLPYLG